MSINKAKLFKTAMIEWDAVNVPEGFSPGEFVAVRYNGRGAFGLNFAISKSDTMSNPVVVSEYILTRFVL